MSISDDMIVWCIARATGTTIDVDGTGKKLLTLCREIFPDEGDDEIALFITEQIASRRR